MLASLAAVVVMFPSSASAAVTQNSSCTDGGKHLWKARSVWGSEYRDAAGVKRITNDTTGFTSAAPDATTVDYSVKGYDGNGQADLLRDRGESGLQLPGRHRLSEPESAESTLGAR